MPQEKKKRGRREEKNDKKRKSADIRDNPSKRFRSENHRPEEADHEIVVSGDAGDDFIGFEIPRPEGAPAPVIEDEFHGLLDPQEQEYYSNINAKIVANDFESDEDRNTFIEAVHRETEGKELKVASSQSCSRYLEKLILLSTPGQLRNLFERLLGNLTSLVRHRFGSHCCETLFLQAAKFVGQDKRPSKNAPETKLASLEDLFLAAAEELRPNMGFLLTERFASHTVRVLFLVLSGWPLDDASVKEILASKKKEKIDTPDNKPVTVSETNRTVPKAFSSALSSLINSAIASLDTTYLRALATHPLGNPVLQLLLQLELSGADKSKASQDLSLFQKLLPDESLDEDTESAKFLSGLIYDPTGSHLVEVFVQKLPGKKFKNLYKAVLKPKLGSMAKNDIAGYVAIRVLERLGKDDLAEAKDVILPEIPALLSRRRTGLIKVLIERAAIRGVDLQDLADLLQTEYSHAELSFLHNILNLKPGNPSLDQGSEDKIEPNPVSQKADVHGSLLAQAMLHSKATAAVVYESLLSLSTAELLTFSNDPSATRLIQAALNPSTTNIAFRRQFVPKFFGSIIPLSLNLTSSYVADALYPATDGLHFMKEKLAQELAISETKLRESPFGRNVWKNWAMDQYQRRPSEWRAVAKGQNVPDQGLHASISQANATSEPPRQEKKTPIQLARERHASRKAQEQNHQASKPATGANAAVSTSA